MPTTEEDFFEKCCGQCRFFLLNQYDNIKGTCTEPTFDYKHTEYFSGNDCWKFKNKSERLIHKSKK